MIMMHYLHVSFPHRFVLGTRPHALRYINQFTEIFTEEGRKSVKITHRVPNHEPRITYTPGLVRERMNNDKAAALLRLQHQQQQQQQAQRQQQQQIQVANAAVAAATAATIGLPLANNGPVSHPAVLQKKTTSLPNATPPTAAAAAAAAAAAQGSPSILQQQLCTPPPASAQLPLHPLPLRPSNGSAAIPGPPTNILQV